MLYVIYMIARESLQEIAEDFDQIFTHYSLNHHAQETKDGMCTHRITAIYHYSEGDPLSRTMVEWKKAHDTNMTPDFCADVVRMGLHSLRDVLIEHHRGSSGLTNFLYSLL